MNKVLKKRLIVGIFSVTLLLSIFIYVFRDLSDPNNSYIKKRQQNIISSEKADLGLMLNDLKNELEKNYLTVQQSKFYTNQKNFEGYKLIIVNVEPTIIDKIVNFLINKEFTIFSKTNTETLLQKNTKMCKISNETNNNFGVYCGLEI